MPDDGLGVANHAAEVMLPYTSVEVWELASLPQGVQPGDRVRIMLTDGDVNMVLLERLHGLHA